jgi:hypothetical protein
VIALPPLDGAVQVTVALESEGVAVTLLGAPGLTGAVGVTEPDGADAPLVPTAFVALTVKV